MTGHTPWSEIKFVCARCGKPTNGSGRIDGKPYHHNDTDERPSCYAQELFVRAFPDLHKPEKAS